MGVVRTLAVILLILVVVIGLAVAALRWRKLRLDEMRAVSRRTNVPMAPPPPPYEVSRGVRLLDGDADPVPAVRGEPPRPRLDPDRHYVFSDATLFDPDAPLPPRARHDDHWALERSARRSHLAPGSGRILIIVVVVLVVLVAIGTYIQHDGGKTPPPTSTTTTTTTTTTVPGHSLGVPMHAPYSTTAWLSHHDEVIAPLRATDSTTSVAALTIRAAYAVGAISLTMNAST